VKIKEIQTIYDILQDESSNITDQHTLVKNGKEYGLSLGRIWFNLLLPDDYSIVDNPVSKKELNE